MRLHNTLTRRVEEFAPQSGEVTLYACGPTVYDHVHIGNLRAYIAVDTLRRALTTGGQQVRAVMNLTDVDDKTIARSRQTHPKLEPQEALGKLTRQYEAVFLQDAAAVGIDLGPVRLVRATEHIPQMQAVILQLLANDLAYTSDDGIYFSLEHYTAKYPYGVLSDVSAATTSHHRIASDEYDKDDARDFALWKSAGPGEPSWDFEVNGRNLPGRPGWHIECSAMSTAYLGAPLDIHAGGVDLKFPHHENEIAQTKGATGHDLARCFVHNEHLLVEGKKMSKSLNNFYTLAEITERQFHPLAFRLLCLQAHYRSELNFTWESLAGAQNRLLNLYAWADLVHQPAHPALEASAITQLEAGVKAALADDLDTPAALASLSDLAGSNTTPTPDLLQFLDQALGLGLVGRPDIDEVAKQLVEQRETARYKQDWPESDRLRQELAKRGLEIDDTPHGPRWRRTNLD